MNLLILILSWGSYHTACSDLEKEAMREYPVTCSGALTDKD